MPILEVAENIMTINKGIFKSKQQFSLDALRLIFLIIPESFNWYVIQSSETRSFVNMVKLSRRYKLNESKLDSV